MTLIVERHSNELWLCLDDGAQSVLLARFNGQQAVDAFKEVFRRSLASAKAAGEMGI